MLPAGATSRWPPERCHRASVATACALAVAACVPLSLASGWRAGLVHLVAVAGGWAYNLGLKRTVLSWLPYAVSFGLLTAFITLGLPGHPAPPWWLVPAGALLGIGAHFLNVVPDVDDDLAAGVRGLPQRLGAARSAVAGAVLLAGGGRRGHRRPRAAAVVGLGRAGGGRAARPPRRARSVPPVPPVPPVPHAYAVPARRRHRRGGGRAARGPRLDLS